MKGCFLFVSLVFLLIQIHECSGYGYLGFGKKRRHSSLIMFQLVPDANGDVLEVAAGASKSTWGSDCSTRFFFGWTTLWKNPPIKLSSRVFRALLKMMIFPTSPGGIYWKNPGEKTLCSWKNARRWFFPLGRNAQKAVSFRGPGTPLGGGEVGGNDLEFVCKKYVFWKNSNWYNPRVFSLRLIFLGGWLKTTVPSVGHLRKRNCSMVWS